MNHFASTLAVEEPEITSVAVEPGVVDTDMQGMLRTGGNNIIKAIEIFISFYLHCIKPWK